MASKIIDRQGNLLILFCLIHAALIATAAGEVHESGACVLKKQLRFLLVFCCGFVNGQTAPAESVFEVASIRPTKSTINGSQWKLSGNGVTMEHIMLDTCIKWAYSLKEYQLLGLVADPSTRFDISAKAERPADPDELKLMMQALLAERFHLKAHWEDKILPGYALIPVKEGFKGKPSLESGPGRMINNGMKIEARSMTLGALADLISKNILHEPVVDMTGIAGKYSFKIDVAGYALEAVEQGSSDSMSILGLLNSLLREQMGLAIEQRKLPLRALVVDHFDKAPQAN